MNIVGYLMGKSVDFVVGSYASSTGFLFKDFLEHIFWKEKDLTELTIKQLIRDFNRRIKKENAKVSNDIDEMYNQVMEENDGNNEES